MTQLPPKIKREVDEYAQKKGLSGAAMEGLLKKVRMIYKDALYSPQEPVGVVSAQSLSEPATQMSLDASEKIIVKHDGMIKVVPIGEFVDKTMEKLGKKDMGGWNVCDVSKYDVFAFSLNGNEKIEETKIKELSRHTAPDKILEIRTRSGRKIRATDSHSFVIRKDNVIIPVSGKELNPGNRLPSMMFLPENCLQDIETKNVIGEQAYVKKPLPETLKLNSELGWIFGAYLAEGNATKFFVSISNTDPLFLSKIRNFAQEYGFSFNEYDNMCGFAPSHDIRINSKQLSQLLENACGTGSSRKRVPSFAYSADIGFVCGLLGGYFDGNGNVSVDRRIIRISSASEELMDGVALLLTRLGIFSRKLKTEKEFSLVIPYKYAHMFRESIGFTIESKAKRLDDLCFLYEENMDSYQDFVDMIGGFGDILLSISKKLGEPSRYMNSFTKRQKIGRTVLLKHIKAFEEKAAKRGIDISKEIAILRRAHNSDVTWDEIVEISYVKPSGKYVYDFTVPGTETFTTAEGIVTHNTMRTYHFAGTAGIQVTLGLPRLLEIFDARKEPRTPTMTVYLDGERQSVDEVKKIAGNIKEVRMKDVVISDTIDLTEMQISYKLNTQKLAELDLETEKLPKLIKIRNINVRAEGDTLIAAPKKSDLSNLHKLKFSVLETHIKGIKGITQVVVNKEGGEWVINTLGSSLKKVFEIEGVDADRTTSNNIFEVLSVLGVEAARNAIIEQARYTIEEQGLGIDMRYIMILADLMTREGDIRAIGRYGLSGQKRSVLARASFEETKKHFINASIHGETDHLRGTVENIMMNQVAPVGTGAFNLVGHIPEIPHGLKGQMKELKKKAKPRKKSAKTKK